MSCSTAQRFTPLASLPGMAERTIKIGSAGKIFSLTGWKVGWMVAAPEMAAVAARAHQFLTFSTAPNLQAAVAFGLERGRCLDRADAAALRPRPRPHDARACAAPAMRCSTRASTYFLCVDLAASGIALDDESFRHGGGRAGRGRGGAAVAPSPRTIRRGTWSGCASARRTRRSTPGSRRWPERRSCSHEPSRGSRASCSSNSGSTQSAASWSAIRRSTAAEIGRVAIGDAGNAAAHAPQQAFLQLAHRAGAAPRRAGPAARRGIARGQGAAGAGWSRWKRARSSRKASAKSRR